jgi:hypothetical protein
MENGIAVNILRDMDNQEKQLGKNASENGHSALLKDRNSISANEDDGEIKKSKMVLDLNNFHVADMLNNASAVTQFLIDISPGLSSQKGEQALSDNGAFGLYIVLTAVKETIDYAVEKL